MTTLFVRDDTENSGFKYEIRFVPGYDFRDDPDPSKQQHGAHGVNMVWMLHGQDATLEFCTYTGWMPGAVHDTGLGHMDFRDDNLFAPVGASIGFHYDKPGGNRQHYPDCDVRKGQTCYYESPYSGLAAGTWFCALVQYGDEGMWKLMRDFYQQARDQ